MLGMTRAAVQAATVADADPSAAPQLEYAMSDLMGADESRPAGGNVASAAAATPANSDQFNPATDEGALTVLGVSLNGRDQADDMIVTVRNGETLVPVDNLHRMRLLFGGPVTEIDGQSFVPLRSVPGIVFRVDKEKQQIQLTAPVSAFEKTDLLAPRQLPKPSQAVRTAFLNYDISVQHAESKTIGSAFIETGVSNALGLVENSMVFSNVGHGRDVVRLDTYATHDDPSGLTRLTIGDTFTAPNSWSPQVRFGGIKWGTDFSLQPGFLSFPTPTFNGQAAVPSNVQLYVNNVLNYQGQVDQGPFALNRLPVVTGAGDVSVVVKDALGVEHRVTSNYYVSTNLLRPGLSDYSIEAGSERYSYGEKSFDYRHPFAAGLFRHGLLPWLTGETRVEVSEHAQTGGVGFSTVVGTIGELGGAVAASHGPHGAGYLYRVFVARASSHFSFSLTYQDQSRDFAQVGLSDYPTRPLKTLQGTVGFSSAQWGSVTASTSYLRLADGTHTRVSALNYNRQIGHVGYLSLFGLRTNSSLGGSETTAGATFSIPLGVRRSIFAQADNHDRRIELQQNIPDDTGWAYRLALAQGEADQQQADLEYRGRAIDLSGSVSHAGGDTAERFLASGGLLLSGSSILPTRRLTDSFAIVDVGKGEKGVRVYQENRQVATTNGAGLAVVTNLRPYESNRISVAPDDLRIDSTISNDTMMVVPRYLAGVSARFRVNAGHAGTVIVQTTAGDPIEPGLIVTYDDGTGTFYSAFDGEVFIDDIREGRILLVKSDKGVCRVTLPAVAKEDVLPRIGPLTCKPVDDGK